MIERKGDLFTTQAKYITHGANTKGVMGSGIAKTVKEKFPANFQEYKSFCDAGRAKPGQYLAVPEKNGLIIGNLFSQDYPGPDARYDWLFSSVLRFAEAVSDERRMRAYGSIIAIPEIGCGIGGLEWKPVKGLLCVVERIYPVEFEVWHFKK